MKKVGASSYELKIPKMWRNLHPVIKTEAIYLLCLRSRMIYNDYHTRQPKCNTGQEVEQILNSRWRRENLQYLAKWQGQPFEEAT